MKRRHKYGAKRTTVDGVVFDSRAEAKRWGELLMLERVGEITKLRRQVEYKLFAAGRDKPVSRLVIDFDYWFGSVHVCDDTKGIATPDWILRAKMFLANYPGCELHVNGKRVDFDKRGNLKL